MDKESNTVERDETGVSGGVSFSGLMVVLVVFGEERVRDFGLVIVELR